MLLAITAGSGAQLAAMASVTLIFALFGFLSPSNRGSLPTVMIVTWTFFGSIAGYVSSRLYVSFDGEAWKRNMVFTSLLFPT
jgi:transmembrane 9 superfamily protein 2/4